MASKIMTNKNFAKLLAPGMSLLLLVAIAVSCGKSTIGNNVVAPTTCIDAHSSVTDSICNMSGSFTAHDHHYHKQVDSGTVVANTTTNTSGNSFSISVSPLKVVSYNSYAYTLVSSTGNVLHFNNANLTDGNQSDIYYYAANDSFVIANVTITYLPNITKTDIDSLFSY